MKLADISIMRAGTGKTSKYLYIVSKKRVSIYTLEILYLYARIPFVVRLVNRTTTE